MTANTKKFSEKPLYKKLIQILPVYVENPFGDTPSLNVESLRIKLKKKSREAVYKWLRKDSLTPKNAAKLINIAQQADNRKVLTKLDREVPELEDLHPFVFGA